MARARIFRCLIVLALLPPLTTCGVNAIPTHDEAAKAAWAQVENQYRRRADLIANLVEVVKGYATPERETLAALLYPGMKPKESFSAQPSSAEAPEAEFN